MKKATLLISLLAIILCSCEKDVTKEIKYLNYQTSEYFIQNDSIYYDLNGDKIDDINLAAVIGAKAFMVKSGYGEDQKFILSSGSFYKYASVVNNLSDAAEIIRKS